MSCPARIVSTALGCLFLWAAMVKLWDVAAFLRAIGDYGLVWEPLLPVTGGSVLLLELMAAGGLLCGRRAGAGLAGALLVVFLCVLGYGIILGLDIDCGCFGTGGVGEGDGLSLKQAMVLDVVLLGCCCMVWRSGRSPRHQT